MFYEMPIKNYKRFKKKMDGLNRRALKLKLFPVICEEAGRYDMEVSFDGAKVAIEMVKVVVEGNDPVIKGWELISYLDHSGAKNVVHSFPDRECPKEYYESESNCDHCGFNRRRIKTFILKDKENEYKQVGSTCLGDFLGHDDPHILAKFYESLFLDYSGELNFDMDDFFMGRGSKIGLENYLIQVAACIREKGWLSSTKSREAGGKSTANLAFDMLYKKVEKKEDLIFPLPEDMEQVDKALGWIKEGKFSNSNEYLWNLHAICSDEFLLHRNMNLAASLIFAYRKMLEDKEKSGFDKGEFQGEIGKKFEGKVKVIGIYEMNGYYGVSYLHKMDFNGNLLVWFSTSKKFEIGEYDLKGTIKKHEVYNGIKQTILTRCKMSN